MQQGPEFVKFAEMQGLDGEIGSCGLSILKSFLFSIIFAATSCLGDGEGFIVEGVVILVEF
jgi:hypothetical protein